MFQNFSFAPAGTFGKLAWRNLKKNKGFSLLNITGLAIGMAAAILILLWMQNEMEKDAKYLKSDRLYLMYNRDHFSGQNFAWNTTPKILGPTIATSYPEIENVVRVNQNSTFLFTVGEKKLIESGCYVDSGFLKMFDFIMINGSADHSLDGIYNIVLTESTAKRYFGNENPMGKTIKIDSSDIFTVAGVVKDPSNTTSFRFNYLLPFAYFNKLYGEDLSWDNNSINTYVLIKPNASVDAYNKKIRTITIEHTKSAANPASTQVFAYPVSKTYLYGKSDNGQLVAGRITTVRLFGVIAAFILLIACINFMNLSTARSEKRAKEVGIRKVVGAERSSLIFQFIAESILLALIAGIIAIGLVMLTLPAYNSLVQKQLAIDWSNLMFWVQLLGFILLTGLLAGSYPAFFLSSFRPIKVLKGTFKASNNAFNPRKVLVVLQFSFAIILMISTVIILRQISYAQDRETGYDRSNVVYTFMQGDIEKHYDAIRQSLIDNGAVTAVTKSMSPITNSWSDSWGFSWVGSTEDDKKLDFIRFSTDGDFMKVMGTSLVEGRDIDLKKYPGDSLSILINETAVKKMRLKGSAVGQYILDKDVKMPIVGVVKDFIINNPYDVVNPIMINGPGTGWFNVIHFKLNSAKSTTASLKLIEDVFKQFNPQYPFSYRFVDDEYSKKFDDTKRTATLAALFAGLTILISCLGLFGLATYMAENRVKEIGVRKVLGASVVSITTLLSRDFLKLIIIAFVIASIVSWYAMKQWLLGYTYRVSLEWWVFAGAGFAAVLISVLTISYQAIKAAIANPVKSLRAE